ncbi:uncharacterized protein LOC119167875 isoform X2 [Rhipicephalus microplus]|uniref:uncharacterized protein LOC119167875 isoform X2 n=1 Tax=Rhipicephalus microplus TaxID=6941 RepID=UPI003F6C9FDC
MHQGCIMHASRLLYCIVVIFASLQRTDILCPPVPTRRTNEPSCAMRINGGCSVAAWGLSSSTGTLDTGGQVSPRLNSTPTQAITSSSEEKAIRGTSNCFAVTTGSGNWHLRKVTLMIEWTHERCDQHGRNYFITSISSYGRPCEGGRQPAGSTGWATSKKRNMTNRDQPARGT